MLLNYIKKYLWMQIITACSKKVINTDNGEKRFKLGVDSAVNCNTCCDSQTKMVGVAAGSGGDGEPRSNGLWSSSSSFSRGRQGPLMCWLWEWYSRRKAKRD